MKIGIDARMYGPKQGGLGRYIQQLILHLEKIDADNEYAIFLRQENWDEYQPANPRFKKILADVPWYGWREQILLPRILNKAKIDLMHFPHWNAPLFYRGPFVVTIHDLLLLHYPTREASTLGPVGYFFKNLAYRAVLRRATRHSRHIIAVSEFTKNDIIKTLKIPAEKISVTYPAPTICHSRESGNLRSLSPIDILDSRLRGNDKYVLYVGVAYPHKNLKRLIEAWKIFQQKHGTNYQLVLVGKKNYFYDKLFNNVTIQQFNNVVFTGFVPDSDLPALYASASLYVFPSLYEGFGLPPLEAIQYGVPVISSNRTCLPEVLRDAALYFNPENTNEMADAIWRGLNDQALRRDLIERGHNLCSNYSWKTLAEKTLQIYNSYK